LRILDAAAVELLPAPAITGATACRLNGDADHLLRVFIGHGGAFAGGAAGPPTARRRRVVLDQERSAFIDRAVAFEWSYERGCTTRKPVNLHCHKNISSSDCRALVFGLWPLVFGLKSLRAWVSAKMT
jgi:hypothetical protein